MTLEQLLDALAISNIRLDSKDDEQLIIRGKNIDSNLLSEIKRQKIALLHWLQINKPTRIDFSQAMPASKQQRAIWLHEKSLTTSQGQYHLNSVLLFDNALDTAKLKLAAEQCIDRHPALRTNFFDRKGILFQQHSHLHDLPFETMQCNHLCIDDILKQEQPWFRKPFNTKDDLLLRIKVIECAEQKLVLFCCHHLITDAYSNQLIINDISKAYQQQLPTHEVFNYFDYSHQQGSYKELKKPALQDTEAFNFIHRAEVHSQAKKIRIALPCSTKESLQNFSNQQKISRYSVYLASLALVLKQYGDNDHFVISASEANRKNSHFSETVGLFVALAPLYFNMEDESNAADFCQRTFQLTQQQDQLFIQTSEDDITHTPHLYDAIISYFHEALDEDTQHESLRYQKLDIESNETKFPLQLSIVDGETPFIELSLSTYTQQKLFSDFQQHFDSAVNFITQNPSANIQTFSVLDENDEQKIWQLGRGETGESPTLSIIDQFRDIAEQKTQSTALILGKKTLSYQQLNVQSDQLAKWISHTYGSNNIIVICAERSFELIIAMLATIKSGNSYCPIDTEQPIQRKKQIMDDAKPCLAFSDELLLTDNTVTMQQITALILDSAEQQISIEPNPVFNIIYTSGSTGTPKGVVVGEKALRNRLHWMQKSLTISNNDIFLQKTSIGFDVSVWEIFLPLISGSTLCLAEPLTEKDPKAINQLITTHHITVCHFVPSALTNQLNEGGDQLSVLTRIILSGEALNHNIAEALLKLNPTPKIYNLYGPTEAAIDVSCHQLTHDSLSNRPSISIGKTIDNVQLYILDKNQRTTPCEAIGELYIGGTALAEGYLNQTELSQKYFINSPLYLHGEPSTQLYKTGDYCKISADGNFTFIQRKDTQKKIRGYRIELNDINANCQQQLSLQESFCAYHNEKIILFYQSSIPLDKKQSLQKLSYYLPNYALPETFIKIEHWPLTLQGKLDDKKLILQVKQTVASNLPNSSQITSIIQSLWENYFNQAVNPDADFFELGGHSLLALTFLASLFEKTGIELQLETLYLHSQLSELAMYIFNSHNQTIPPQTFDTSLVSRQQKLLLSFQKLHPTAFNYNMPGAFHIRRQLQLKYLEKSILTVLKNNPVISSYYLLDNNTAKAIPVDIGDWQLNYQSIKDTDLKESLKDFYQKPFDLSQEIPFRAEVFKLNDQHFVLSFVIHHIAADAWSLHLLYQQIFDQYQRYLVNSPVIPSNENSINYCQYANQQALLPQASYQDFWITQLADVKALTLPHDFNRTIHNNYSGKQYHYHFSENFSTQLHDFCQQQHITPFIFCLSVYQCLLGKLSHQEDVPVALALSGRNNSQYLDVIGYFVNTVIIRSRPLKELSAEEFLQRQKLLISDVLTHQDVNTEKLFENLASTNSAIDKIANLGFNFLEYSHLFQHPILNSSDVESIDIDPGFSKLDMSWLFSLNQKQLKLCIEYNDTLFHEETMVQWLEYFEHLSLEFINQPSHYLGNCHCLDDAAIYSSLANKIDHIEKFYPLTPLQKDLYVDSLINQNQQNHTGFYTVSDADADLDVWQDSIYKLYEKTDLLRTVITQSEHPLLEFAYQVIQQSNPDTFNDCQQVIIETDTVLDDELIEKLTTQELKNSFAEENPLWRAKTYAFKNNMKLFVFTSHHALFDGINTQLIGTLIKSNYQCLIENTPLNFTENNFETIAREHFITLNQQNHIQYWQQKSNDVSKLLDYRSLTETTRTHIAEAFYQSDEKTLQQLQSFCKSHRTTLSHFYKALFALTIKHYHALQNSFVLAEITAGRTAQEFLIPGLMFEQQINIINTDVLSSTTFKEWLSSSAKLRKEIKKHGKMSLSKQQEIFSDKLDYIYNFYIMNTETEFLGRKEKIGHLIPRIEGKQNLVVSLVDEKLRLQFFYPETNVDGEDFLSLLCKLQQEILSGSENLDTLNQQHDDAIFYVDHHGPFKGDTFYPLSQTQNGTGYQLINPWQQPSLNTPGRLVALNNEVQPEHTAKIVGDSLYIFPENTAQRESSQTLPARNTLETSLLTIWQEVLDIQAIDITDNFFSLGGNSLHAMRIAYLLQERLGISLAIHQVFKNPSIAGICNEVLNNSLLHDNLPRIKKVNPIGQHPISQAQRRLWLLHKTAQLSNEYNILIQINIKGTLNIERLHKAYTQLLRKHSTLRLSLQANGLDIHQELLSENLFSLQTFVANNGIQDLLEQHRKHTFTIDNLSPLSLAALYTVSSTEHILSFCIHHIVCDAESLQIIALDLLALYQNPSQGALAHNINFIDYCHWQEQLHSTGKLVQATEYWKHYLHNIPIEMGLKNDYPREQQTALSASQVYATIDQATLSKIDLLCQQFGISRYMLLLFTFHISLAKHSGNRDIAVGISRDGRFSPALKNSVGFYINALIIRFVFDSNQNTDNLVKRFSEQLLRCYQYEYLNVDDVINALKLPRKINLFPIVQAAFNYIEPGSNLSHLSNDDFDVSLIEQSSPSAKFDLVLNGFIDNDCLQLSFEYSDELFFNETIKSIAKDYQLTLDNIISDCTAPIYTLIDSSNNAFTPSLDKPETLTYWQNKIQRIEPLFNTVTNGRRFQTLDIVLSDSTFDNLLDFSQTHGIDSQSIIITTLTFLLRQYFDQADGVIIKDVDGFYLLEKPINNILKQLLKLQQTKSEQLSFQALSHYQKEKLFSQLPTITFNTDDESALSLRLIEHAIQLIIPDCITISNIEKRFVFILSQILTQENFTDISLIFDHEQIEFQPPLNVPQSFLERIYQYTPINHSRTAVTVDSSSISYADLIRYSNAFCSELNNLALSRQSRIAICLPYSIYYLPVLLGTLQAAHIYIPIDINLPQDRINYMLQDSEPDVIIGAKNLSFEFNFTSKVLLIEDINWHIKSDMHIEPYQKNDIAYLMYTSGSTGLAKACAIYRDSFEHLIYWYQSTFSFDDSDNSLVISSPGFDLSQKNFFAPLSSGGSLQLYHQPLFNDAVILNIINKQSISRINCAPSAFYPLIENSASDSLACLKTVFLGGEEINPSRINTWQSSSDCHADIINMYGPTECTDISTYHQLSKTNTPDEPISIGKAINGVSLHLQNSQGYLVPEGFTGELLIGGIGLSQGYINNKKRNNNHFIQHQILEQTLYCSGDLAISKNGVFYYRGRRDDQIKINGVRIEPAEIQHALNNLCHVQDAITLTINSSEHTRLVAFALSDETTLPQWRTDLRQTLPSHMVPTALTLLKQWPLTRNGKIDRQKLLQLSATTEPDRAITETNSAIESQLTNLWHQVLHQYPPNIDSNFFELGGDSLTALRLLHAIEKHFSISLPISQLFNAQSIRQQASIIERQQQPFSSLIELHKGSESNIFAIHDISGLTFNFQALAKNLSPHGFYALQAYGFETEQSPFTELDAMVDYYCDEITQQQSTGPYQLLGYSFGGVIAIEVARRLFQKGHTISYLGLIDSYLPKSYIKNDANDARLIHHLIKQLLPNATLSYATLKTLNTQQMLDVANQQLQGLIPKHYLESALQVQKGLYSMLESLEIKPIDLPLHLYRATQAESNIGHLFKKLSGKLDSQLGWGKVTDKLTILEFNQTHFTILDSTELTEHIANDLTLIEDTRDQ